MSLQQIGPATSANTTDIATNTADIATNTADIAANTANIATNTSDIGTINSAIAGGIVSTIAGNSGAFTLGGGITNSTNLIKLSLLNATLQASPSDPTGTTSTSAVMMGLGGTCKITPVYSSRVEIRFQGSLANTTSTQLVSLGARFGTGTAPSNGAAASGTTVGSVVTGWVAANNGQLPFGGVGGIITGLTPGTAYWFDLTALVSSGTGSLANISFSAMEF